MEIHTINIISNNNNNNKLALNSNIVTKTCSLNISPNNVKTVNVTTRL